MASHPTTPRKRKNSLAAHHVKHTPFNVKSNQHSPNTQDMGTQEILQKQQQQEELMATLKQELRGVTYEADWVADHFCHAPPEKVDNVMASLRKAQIWRPSVARNFSVRSMKLWPSRAATELRYYKPFVALLNAITAAFEECFPDDYQSSLFQSVSFVAYAKTMQESVTGEYVLRPDILALIQGLAKGQASWYAAILAGEVKGDWGRLILQAGTYARSLFAATDHRTFIPILALRHTTSEFRLLFYHRSGMLATHGMNLKTEAGLRDLVSTIVGMWLWQTPYQAGYESTQVPKYFSFNDTKYYIHSVVCRRQAIRGRATTVYAVKRAKVPDGQSRYFATPRVDCGGKEWMCLNPFDLVDPPTDPNDIEETIETQNLPVDLPDSFIVKCSHQLYNRDSEVDVFRDVQGYIGIPDIITQYDSVDFVIPDDETVTPWRPTCLRESVPIAYSDDEDDDEPEASNDEAQEGSDDDEVPEGSDDGAYTSDVESESSLDINDSPSRPYESRLHRHLLVKTVGMRLTNDLTFQQVGTAMLHALIGHCALFTKGGYLHRDISNGNILMLSEPQQSRKIPPILDGIITESICNAVLIDGDVAKKWGSPANASDRSGTLPFMSARLLNLWVEDGELIHTPIDDFESFAWVLLYNALAWTPAKFRTVAETRWWSNLNEENLEHLSNYKSLAIGVHWANTAEYQNLQMSGIVRPFASMIYEWFGTTRKYFRTLTRYEMERREPAEFSNLFADAYQELVRVVKEERDKLPDIPINSVVLKRKRNPARR
ncbi:hypothetical protein HGRIS_004404 [Hohenbuehelia grisea]|uniref:Fungal-type protein kinase domain-containing protein n=1 Tax=Hohenbuehelia grisea TaxID=104357 RepID=A0ABR3JC46_9AGAR